MDPSHYPIENRTMPFSIPCSLRAAFAAPTAIALMAGLLSLAPEHLRAQQAAHVPGEHTLHVTKTPTCGCCTAWAELARSAGYEVTVTDTTDFVGMKSAANVPEALVSCHTTRVGGYVVEGHVPFAAVAKLMTEKPDIAGIAVPGMPMGSPGMGDDPNARYDVIAYGGGAGEGAVFFRAGVDGASAPADAVPTTEAPAANAPGALDRSPGDATR